MTEKTEKMLEVLTLIYGDRTDELFELVGGFAECRGRKADGSTAVFCLENGKKINVPGHRLWGAIGEKVLAENPNATNAELEYEIRRLVAHYEMPVWLGPYYYCNPNTNTERREIKLQPEESRLAQEAAFKAELREQERRREEAAKGQ
jgi:hypothetical protein